MGFLSSITGAIKTVGETIAKVAVVAPANAISNIIKKGSGTATVADIPKPLTIAIGATATALGAAVAAPLVIKAAPTIAKAAVPTTPKGLITAAVITPVAVGAVVSQPAKVAEAIVKAPIELGKFGGDVATFAAAPSLESAKEIITESPLISAAAGVLAVGGVAKAAAPIIGGALTREAIQEQTEALTKVQTLPAGITVTDKSAEFTQKTLEQPSISPVSPVTPQTKTVTSTTSKRRKKRISKPVMASMNQRVNVIVSNIANKKYINRSVLAV